MSVKSVIFNDASLFFDLGIHIPSKTLYWGNSVLGSGDESEINADFAQKAIKGLHYLDTQHSSEKPIRVILNGTGGDWYYCTAVGNFIQNIKSKVNIDVFGPAFSATCALLQYATGVRRVSKNSRLMLHYGLFEISDYSKIVKNWAVELNRSDLEMEDLFYNKIVAKKPDFKRETLKEILNVDTILEAKEVVDLGLADEII